VTASDDAVRPGRLVAGAPELLVLPLAVLLLVLALTPPSTFFTHHGDVVLYMQFGERLLRGDVPYRDLQPYPPLSFVPFVLPYLLWPLRPMSIETYQWLFLVQNAAFCAITALVIAWIAGRSAGWPGATRALATYGVLIVAIAPLVAWRYDVFPAMLTALAVASVVAGRPALAGISLALAILAKLYPVVLLPILAARYLTAAQWRALLRFGLAGAAVLALGAAPFLLAAPSAIFAQLDYHARRPLQIESVPAGIVLLAHEFGGAPVQVVHAFTSVNVGSPLASAFLAILPAVAGLALLSVLALALLRFRNEHDRSGAVRTETLIAYVLAALLALIATSKVFSSQYVVWLLPFAALLPRPQALLAALVCAMTLQIHPLNYEKLIDLQTQPIVILNWRNLLVVSLLVWIVAAHLPFALPHPGLRRLIPARLAVRVGTHGAGSAPADGRSP
jgi:uncharacterized membrane protein